MLLNILLLSGLLLHFDQPPKVVDQSAVRVERHFNLMGTTLTISVEALDRRIALSASEEALKVLQKAEKRLSTWTNNSELARLNQTAVGQPVILSTELAMELTDVQHWWKVTEGAFDPGIGALSAIWGLRTGGNIPTAESIRKIISSPKFDALHIKESIATRLHPDLSIDEGGFGKGAGLDDAIRCLSEKEVTGAVLNLGGQIAILGSSSPYLFKISHPIDRNIPVLSLTINQGALATSGNSERFLKIDGEKYSHILDPRNGRPVPNFGSLTVWAENALAADCLSTGLYVLGPKQALEWAKKNDGIEILVLEITRNGLLAQATKGFKNRIKKEGPDVALTFL
tara:strand:- start:151563 stop:152588 length:1026 start_codon:yes stop_codon:yes gene_type:complete